MSNFAHGTFGWLMTAPVAEAARHVKTNIIYRYSNSPADQRKRTASLYLRRLLQFRKYYARNPELYTSIVFSQYDGMEQIQASAYFPESRKQRPLSYIIRKTVDELTHEFGYHQTEKSEHALKSFISHFSGLYHCQTIEQVPDSWAKHFSTLLKRLARRLGARPSKLWSRIHQQLLTLDHDHFGYTPVQQEFYARVQKFFTSQIDDNRVSPMTYSVSPCRCCAGVRKTRVISAYSNRRIDVYENGMTSSEVASRMDNDPDFEVESETVVVNIRNGMDYRYNRGDESYALCDKCLSDGSEPGEYINLHRGTASLYQAGQISTDTTPGHIVEFNGSPVILMSMLPFPAEVWVTTYTELEQFRQREFNSVAPVDFIRPYGTVNVRDLQTDDDGWRAGLELEVETPERTKFSRMLYREFNRDESQVSQVRDGSLSDTEGVEILTGWGSLKTVSVLLDRISNHLQTYKAYKSPDSCGLHVNLSHVRKRYGGVDRMTPYSWAKLVQFWNDPANARMILAVAGRYNVHYCQVKRDRGTPAFSKRVKLGGWSTLRYNASHTDIVNVENDNRIEVRAFKSDTDPCVVLGRAAFAMLTAMYATAGNRGPDSINGASFCHWFMNRRKDCHLKTAFSEFTTKVLRTAPVNILELSDSARYC
jgi:hypothetical protein